MFKLYFKGCFQSAHDNFGEAEAQARWNFFEFQGFPWEGFYMPAGFMIAIEGDNEK